MKKKFYRSRNVTFRENINVLPFQDNDPVGAVTDSVGVNNAQTSATDAN